MANTKRKVVGKKPVSLKKPKKAAAKKPQRSLVPTKEEAVQAALAQAACATAMEHGGAMPPDPEVHDLIAQPLPPPGKRLVKLSFKDMTSGYPVNHIASKVRVVYNDPGEIEVYLEHGVDKDIVKMTGVEQ